jgi:succinate dehydrogenase / fumarate reductase cytochrome b subunit
MMDRVDRPLSPHLQVYRMLRITSALSILHRMTGVVLSIGLLVLTYWLVALAGGSADYAAATALLGSPVLRLAYVGFSFCFFYHLANGIRHLVWDIGLGFEHRQIAVGGWLAVIAAAGATAAFSFAVIL